LHGDARRYLRHHPFPRVRLVANPSGSREGRVRALAKAIRSVRPDCVLGVNIVDAYDAVARLRRGGNGVPRMAMALHGLNPCFQDDIARWRRHLDAVIATNRLGVAAAIRFGGMAADRVHYAPCGVGIPQRLAAPDGSNGLTLLFAGRFDAGTKRVLDLPPILRALDRREVAFRVRLAGAGPAERELRAAMAAFGSRVEFVGVLNASQLRESFLRPGAVALVLSPSETGPLIAWEAMASGAAVVTSQFVGIGLEGALRDGETCLTFPVGDHEAAAAAIARLSEAALREGLIRRGRQVVEARYGHAASVRAWDRALRIVVGQSPLVGEPPRSDVPVSGRLDRYFGTRAAESLRRVLRVRFRHRAPGDEWPHSYGSDENDPLLRELEAMDRAGMADGTR
jgi:glycosyltransferase involved in cell wall biosynthesis